jgi:hypothetical protein
MASGKLPWSGHDDKDSIAAEKSAADIADRLMIGLPAQLGRVWETVTQYAYDDQPDYELLRSFLMDAMDAEGIGFDDRFDWEKLSQAEKKRLSVVSFDIPRGDAELHEVKEGCNCCEVA